MAEAVVSVAVERLGELLISEIKHLHGVSDKVEEIQLELKRMQCFLKEADKKQIQDERVKNWVAEIRDLAFKIEDVIETFAIEVPTSKDQKSGFKKMLRRFACILNEGASRHNISTKIDAIKVEIAGLRESLHTYGIKSLQEGETLNSAINQKNKRIFYGHIVENDFVGMAREIEQLISSLKKEDKGCEVLSICGMGGQGKTTLAQKLYNHYQVRVHFKRFAWVCITQQFDGGKVLKEVLKQLIHDTRKNEVATMYDGELVGELYKVQKENNCLVVLDDIWTTDSWRRLRDAFPVGETTSGSKILLTTRDERVAEIGHVHKIKGLTTEEGWQLLSKKARINDIVSNEIVASQMEGIGKKMVEKCKHLPLAISSIGGLLSGKLLEDWKMIENHISFYLREGRGVTNDDEYDDEYHTVRQVLGLSYDSLPSHLRHCFLCFAKFKEDEVINTEELYIIWMAEGLISVKHKAKGEMMLDVAERFMEELAHGSLVQVEEREIKGESWSKYKTCRLHDLIRDLCLFKAKEEKFIKVVQLEPQYEDESRSSIARKLCINPYIGEWMLEPFYMLSHVRSLFVVAGFRGVVSWPDKILSLQQLKLLRVFTAHRFTFTKQEMKIISELVYLKCLSLSQCELEEFPSSISKLRNLEILDLQGSEVRLMRNVLWKLRHLKYLHLSQGSQVVYEKLSVKDLDELEVILNFNSEFCDTYELFGLRKLKVLSGYFNLKNNVDLEKFLLDFIISRELRYSSLMIRSEGALSFVSWLECCFINILTIEAPLVYRLPKEYDHTRLSSSCLCQLTLEGSRMEEDPMILLEKLPNLCELSLWEDAYLGTEMVCTANGFPKLQVLYLWNLKGLKQWRVEEGAMKKLSELSIVKCYELEMLPEGLSYLSALQYLRIDMPDTFKDRINGIDGAEGVDKYKISHVSHLDVC